MHCETRETRESPPPATCTTSHSSPPTPLVEACWIGTSSHRQAWFTVQENADSPYVVHHQEGRTRPTSGVTDAERLNQLNGDVLRLGGRPRANDDLAGGHLYWELQPHRPE